MSYNLLLLIVLLGRYSVKNDDSLYFSRPKYEGNEQNCICLLT